MEILIGFGGVFLFLLLTIVVMELNGRKSTNFSDYATAGRSFGPYFATMAYVNTFLPGTVFISFAGLAALSGIIGYYLTAYALLGVVVMLALSKPVFRWGKQFDLRTQNDLLGLRYRSNAVRVVSAIIGVIATIPWIVLGLQSLGLVFDYLSGHALSAIVAIVLSVVVVVIRQIWTVKHGMRGIIVSDMVQGIVAYIICTLVAIGLISMLVTNGHGFGDVPDSFYSLRGPNGEYGPLYAVSLVITGALGTWCWPDIFVRLFTVRSVKTLRKTASLSAPLMLIFTLAVLTVAFLASSDQRVAEAPDHVWFIIASDAGIWVLTIAALGVVAGTLGNVGANIQAVGAQFANDIYGVLFPKKKLSLKVGKIAITITTLVSAIFALATVTTVSGLVGLAMLSYQGIVQLAPTLLLGILWKRATAAGAVSGMIVGFVLAAILQMFYPVQIPWLGGLTSGLVAMILNAGVIIAVSILKPQSAKERQRVEELWSLTHSDIPDEKLVSVAK